MDPITGAVVMVGLYQAGKPSVELVTGFINRIFGPAADVLGDTVAHPIREWQRLRVERATQVVVTAAEIVDRSDGEAHEVPPRLLLPILEKASLEDAASLQEKWAALLANAAIQESSVLPAYADILGLLTPLDAFILENVDSTASRMPGVTSRDCLLGIEHYYWPPNIPRDLLKTQYQVRMENLHRLGLINPVMARLHHGDEGSGVLIPTGTRQYSDVTLTELGRAFLIACTPPDRQHWYQKEDNP